MLCVIKGKQGANAVAKYPFLVLIDDVLLTSEQLSSVGVKSYLRGALT